MKNGSQSSDVRGAWGTRIAILCRHDLSNLRSGDSVNTYDKIVALGRQLDSMLLIPCGYSPIEVNSQMTVVEVSRPGFRFIIGLTFFLLLHSKRYDCVFTRDPLLAVCAIPAKMLRKPLVIEMHGLPSLETEIRRRTSKVRNPRLTSLICSLMRAIETLSIREADLVLPVTSKMRNTLLQDYGAVSERVVVLPNSVDTEMFRPLAAERNEMRRRLGVEDKTVVLFLSTFSARWRGTDKLFQAAYAVEESVDDVVYLVVGSGPLLEEIKARNKARLVPNRFLLIGTVDFRLIPLYMNAADIYVYDVVEIDNRLIEKQGLCPAKILQAMSCALPFIAPNESELASMVLESRGGFCSSSYEDVISIIKRFADSRDLARSMGLNARRYVKQNHDLEDLTKLKVRMIENIVRSGKRQQGNG